jgi:chromosomal replication initiation ATPase DnaA
MKKIEKKDMMVDDRELPELKGMKLLSPDQIKQLILNEFSIDDAELMEKKRNAGEFRKLYVYSLKCFSPLKLGEIGDLVGLDYSAVSRLCIRFEEMIKFQGNLKRLFTRLKKSIKKAGFLND